ncbi:MAG: hypothetical protein GWM98_19095 [Nitrospinaceae bacterium]|nr:hypothetical protein [Nitrospinaceae bacterium]NIR56199.1 hypothetical protein [Nitrospinaceae bacterium]NIS86655.1 hypothetical protein [Nitrospinaceae bacterium]NIT83488.1 hypothetical protein [Nitrospinaceae bacterium]NIU45693.1 hypothetical protein [Nitrospinaceae bacterium]
MFIFAKDIGERDHKHSRESEHPPLREYMVYQRKLFPYTIVRAGLDLAYKELDDILSYIDNDYQKPADSTREDYPADIPEWYRTRFPWSGSFMSMEDMHALLVRLIQSMDSFRSYERGNSYHYAVLYDSTHNIVNVYNELLARDPHQARDIHLSNGVEVDFEDFVNNYWPHLEFMILSKPDYAHPRLMERVRQIEDEIKQRLDDGLPPLEALAQAGRMFTLDPATLPLLRRDPIAPELAELDSLPLEEAPYSHLSQIVPEDSPYAGRTVLDAEYEANHKISQLRTPA